MITERRLAANRRNARASTGPRTAAGKARVARNARRHGLNVAVADDPALSAEAAELARAILDGLPSPSPLVGEGRGGGSGGCDARVPHSPTPTPDPSPQGGGEKKGGLANAAPAPAATLVYLARRVAEAQVDVMRVRRARHHMIAGALANPRYRSPRHLRRHVAMLGGVVDLLTRGLPVPDDMRKAAFGRPQGALKFALILADLADRLARLDRYERRALSRRKAAVQEFDAARAGRSRGELIVLSGIGPQERAAHVAPPDDAARQRAARSVRRWQNKPTAAPASGRESSSKNSSSGTLPPRPWGDKPIKQVPYREIAAYVAKLLHIEWPERTEGARDGPGQTGRVGEGMQSESGAVGLGSSPLPACGERSTEAREGEGAHSES